MSGYGVKKAALIVVNEENAISTGRYIKNIEYRKTDKAEFITIEVRDEAGATARKSYFPPKIGTGFVQTKEQLEKEQNKFNRVMSNLTNVLISPSYETGTVDSFEEFCNKVINDIGKSYYDKELRIKLVLDKKNFPTLPNYPIMFEDPTLVSDSSTRMKLTQWDKVKPSEIVMDEDKKDDLDIAKKTTDDDSDLSDLPF